LKVSIIIPIYNEAENIVNLLKSIFLSKFKKKEIIVIDDGSTDNTSKILEKYKNKIKYISIKKSGVAKARNIGIKKSKGNLLLFFDGDVVLKKNTIYKFIKYFRENKNLNILQGIWERKYFCKTNYITKHLLLKLNFNFEQKYKKEKKFFNFKGIKVSELLTGCLGVRKKIFKNFKFNEGFKKAGGEEFELGSRIFEKYDIFYTSKIKVYHRFENIFETLKRIFFRTINYTILNLSSSKDKRKIFTKYNETSVPKRDINNLFIVSSIIFSAVGLFFSLNFLVMLIMSCIIFFFNNIELLLYIKKNTNLFSLIKSYFTELIIILVKICSITLSMIFVYIFKLKNYKI